MHITIPIGRIVAQFLDFGAKNSSMNLTSPWVVSNYFEIHLLNVKRLRRENY